MLTVKDVKSLEKEIRTAYDENVRKLLRAYADQLNEEIKDNEEFANAVLKEIMERLSKGIYYLTRDYNDRYCINTSSMSVYFDNIDKDIVHRRDADECNELIKHLKEERNLMLDIIYSRPSEEELSKVYDYILGSKTTIECAK
mgnify:FL=1